MQKPKKIDHIGIAVNELDPALEVYSNILGLTCSERKKIEARGLEIAFLEAGQTMIELLAPLSADSEVSRFLSKRGEGIHHICLEVTDIKAAVEDLQARGVHMITTEPQIGAEGYPVLFIHPKATNGVLLELIEK